MARRRIAIAHRHDEGAITSMSSTTADSAAFGLGTMMPRLRGLRSGSHKPGRHRPYSGQKAENRPPGKSLNFTVVQQVEGGDTEQARDSAGKIVPPDDKETDQQDEKRSTVTSRNAATPAMATSTSYIKMTRA
jgi:hypothetical protein